MPMVVGAKPAIYGVTWWLAHCHNAQWACRIPEGFGDQVFASLNLPETTAFDGDSIQALLTQKCEQGEMDSWEDFLSFILEVFPEHKIEY